MWKRIMRFGLAFGLTAAAGAATVARADLGQDMQKAAKETDQASRDSAITTKVKTKIWNDVPDGLHVHVTTTDGVVTLTGAVPSEAARQQAADIARKTSDVAAVDNKIAVKPGQ
jgi:hyperosmotically inducible protein